MKTRANAPPPRFRGRDQHFTAGFGRMRRRHDSIQRRTSPRGRRDRGTIGLYGNNSTTEKEAVSFDARAIIIEKKRIREYFSCRQKFSVWKFIEKLCKCYGFKGHSYTIEQIDKELQKVGEKWDNYPRNIRYGFVGYYNGSGQWQAEAAKDFRTEWHDYSTAIDRLKK